MGGAYDATTWGMMMGLAAAGEVGAAPTADINRLMRRRKTTTEPDFSHMEP